MRYFQPPAIPNRMFTRAGRITNAAGVEQPIGVVGGIQDLDNVAADGNRRFFYLHCNGTETILAIYVIVAADRGIFDLYINDVLDSAGYDTFTGEPATYNVALAVFPRSGVNIVEFRTNGQNIGSAGFYIGTYGVRFHQ